MRDSRRGPAASIPSSRRAMISSPAALATAAQKSRNRNTKRHPSHGPIPGPDVLRNIIAGPGPVRKGRERPENRQKTRPGGQKIT